MLLRLSAFWARLELAASALLAVGVTLLILLNVVTRNAGAAIYWVDEAAIYAMVWMTFLGASAAIHYGQSVAITVLTDVLPEPGQRIAAKLVDLLVFIFAVSMLWFCWRWFLPLEILRADFDVVAFQGNTFNFVYAEPTSTLGIPKWPVWMVMWLFAFGATLHSTACLLDFTQPPEKLPA